MEEAVLAVTKYALQILVANVASIWWVHFKTPKGKEGGFSWQHYTLLWWISPSDLNVVYHSKLMAGLVIKSDEGPQNEGFPLHPGANPDEFGVLSKIYCKRKAATTSSWFVPHQDADTMEEVALPVLLETPQIYLNDASSSFVFFLTSSIAILRGTLFTVHWH